MTTDEFNEKYKDYLSPGHYGMSIEIPEVIDLVDRKFEEWSKLPGFHYTQVKLKFGMSRVYADADGVILQTSALEHEIDKIIKTNIIR